jgi:hypothetical protein
MGVADTLLLSLIRRRGFSRSPRDHAPTVSTESLAFGVVKSAIGAFHEAQPGLGWLFEVQPATAAEPLALRILDTTLRALHRHGPRYRSRAYYLFLLVLPVRCLLIFSLTVRFLLLGDLMYEILTPPPSAITFLAYMPLAEPEGRLSPFPRPAEVPVPFKGFQGRTLGLPDLAYTIISGYRVIV